MENKYNALFTPFKIGNCEINNRVVLCAMEGTSIVEWMAGKGFDKDCHDYYIERAKNGVGLFIPGLTPVRTMVGNKWLNQHPKAFNGVKEIMDEIHSYGSKVFFQLGTGFAGRNFTFMGFMSKLMDNKILKTMAKPVFNMDALMVSASENPNVWNPEYFCRELTVEEIQEYINAYAEVAYMCKINGVDGVEVHAVHEGYLLDQFATKYTNRRTDEYGGTFENRYRFAVEVVKAIKQKCGDDYPVMLRYSVTSKVKDFNDGALPGEQFTEIGRDMEESEMAAKYLQDAGYDALNCDNGTYDSWYWAHPPVYMPLNTNLKEAEHIKQFVDIPIICAGRLQADVANKAIEEGKLDGYGVARQFLCDSEFLIKLKEGREADIRPCISCHNGCLPTGLYKGSGGVTMVTRKGMNSSGDCALNPVCHHEKRYNFDKVAKPKNVAVIGGGIGGMEVSRLLAMKGHNVDLYEKSDELGGVFIAAAAPSFKEKDKALIEWYRKQINDSENITVHFGCEIKDLSNISADEFVIATGASARKLKIAGSEKAVEAIDYLRGAEVGERVAVIGGGLTGCEIAYDLALKGKKPIIVEMLDDILKIKSLNMANSTCLRQYLKMYDVPVYLESSLVAITDKGIVIMAKDNSTSEIECDSVITSVGYISGTDLVEEKMPKNVHVLGDAKVVGNLLNVVWDAYDLANKI